MSQQFPPGLDVKVTKDVPSAKRKSQKGDTISVHYKGTLASDGSKFDASYDRGVPLDFKIGDGMVIEAWEKGLVGMAVGEKRTITSPPQYAYKERGFPPVIPPSATLIFETELMGIKGVSKDEL